MQGESAGVDPRPKRFAKVGAVFGLGLPGSKTVVVAAVLADRPNGLLTAIAMVCLLGSAVAMIRAIIIYRLFNTN